MRIQNEKQLLPLARQPWLILDQELGSLLMPQFEDFLHSEKTEDTYKGWALDIHFIRQNCVDYQHYIARSDYSRLKELSEDWKYTPSIEKDDNILIYSGEDLNVLIVFHLHSFLWNYPTPEELDDDDE